MTRGKEWDSIAQNHKEILVTLGSMIEKIPEPFKGTLTLQIIEEAFPNLTYLELYDN